MSDYLIPIAINSFVALCAFRMGWLARNRHALRAISGMAALHSRNVAAAHERGNREGILSQMAAETANARRP